MTEATQQRINRLIRVYRKKALSTDKNDYWNGQLLRAKALTISTWTTETQNIPRIQVNRAFFA